LKTNNEKLIECERLLKEWGEELITNENELSHLAERCISLIEFEIESLSNKPNKKQK